jgi:hypothetical protein
MALATKQRHIKHMTPCVTFKIAENDWQIAAKCPGTETHYIKGLKSKENVDEWLAGSRRIAWLRSQAYAKMTSAWSGIWVLYIPGLARVDDPR